MRAVVCGAGVAGLTLAWWLRRDGWDVVVLERAPGPRAGGYMMDFFGSGFDVAERMGLLPALRARQARIDRLVYQDADGRVSADVTYGSLAEVLRGRVVSLMRGHLEEALHGALGEPHLVRYGTSVEDVRLTRAAVDVGLTDGSRVEADLLVGADGIHSRVRTLAIGPEPRFLRRLGFHTASYVLHDEELRAEVGDRMVVVRAPGRQVGLYPTGDGHLAVSLLHASRGRPLPQDPALQVRRVHAGLGPLADRALAHVPDDGSLYYDEVAQVELDRWSSGRVALVGDACQAVSLMAGQGASLAMGGAWVLATALRTHPDDVGAALAEYEARMVPHVRRTQRAGRTTARWMVPDEPWRIALRDRLLGVADLPGGPVLLRPTMRAAAASVVP